MSAGLRSVVVVGASLAGSRAAAQLRAEGFDGRLEVLGAERHRPYDRPPLSKELLKGDADDVSLRCAEDVEWVLGDAAVRLDLAARTVQTASGRELAFDGLVIATGSAPRRLAELDPARRGVVELRTLDDALALRSALAARPRLAIVGGGFIGVEVASTARALGVEVELVTRDPPLIAAGRLVSETAAAMLPDHGVAVHAGRRVAATLGGERVEGLVLDDGTRVAADLVLSAVGAAPITGWLAGSGLRVADGIECDAACAALGAERVVACGDVARWPNAAFGGASMRIEHWTNAAEQGVAAARTLLHDAAAGEYAPIPSFWSDHFGVRMQCIGMPARADRFEIVEGAPADRRFAAAAYRGDRLVGGVAYGMPRPLARLRAQLARAARPAEASGAAARR